MIRSIICASLVGLTLLALSVAFLGLDLKGAPCIASHTEYVPDTYRLVPMGKTLLPIYTPGHDVVVCDRRGGG